DKSIAREISIFEHLYLFNWRTGHAFHTPNDLKPLIQQIRRLGRNPSADDVLKNLSKHPNVEHFTVHFDGVPIEEVARENLSARISFHPGDKRNLVAVELEFFNEQEILCPAPEFFQTLTFGHGLLSSFKKKKDGYEFTKMLADYFVNQDDSYKKSLIGISSKDKMQEVLDRLTENETSIHYDGDRKILQTFDNRLLKNIFITLTTEFGEILYRFATYSPETKAIRYEIAASNLFQGLAAVSRKLSPFGVQLYYDREK